MSEVNWHSEDFEKQIQGKLRLKLAAAGELVASNARALMRETKSGSDVPVGFKKYPDKKGAAGRIRGFGARRSAPGEAPAVQTSRLIQSIAHEPLVGQLGERVGTNVKYGFFLELGTRGGTVITPKQAKALSWIGPDGQRVFARKVVMKPLAARPWLRPALARSMPRIWRMFGG